jgi:hypothetical protein
VDVACSFFHTFLFLNVRFVLKYIQRDVLALEPIEVFNLEDLINQLLSLSSLYVVLFQHRYVSHEVHKSLLVGLDFAHFSKLIVRDLVCASEESLEVSHLSVVNVVN